MAIDLKDLDKNFQDKVNQKINKNNKDLDLKIERMLKNFQSVQQSVKELKNDYSKLEREAKNLERQNKDLKRKVEQNSTKNENRINRIESQSQLKIQSLENELKKLKTQNTEREEVLKSQNKESKFNDSNKSDSVKTSTNKKSNNPRVANIESNVEDLDVINKNEILKREKIESAKNLKEKNKQEKINLNGAKDLTNQFGDFGRVLTSVMKPLIAFGATISSLLSTLLFFKGINRIVDTEKKTSLDDIKSGLSPETSRAIKSFSKVVGVNGEGVVSDFDKWNTKMESAWATGNDPFTTEQRMALFGSGAKQLGLNQQIFNKLRSPQDQLQYIINSLAGIKDQDKFNNVRSTLLSTGAVGDSIIDLVTKSRIAGIKDINGTIEQYKTRMENPQDLLQNQLNFATNWQNITDRWDNITLKFENVILQGLVPILEKIGDLVLFSNDKEETKIAKNLNSVIKKNGIDFINTPEGEAMMNGAGMNGLGILPSSLSFLGSSVPNKYANIAIQAVNEKNIDKKMALARIVDLALEKFNKDQYREFGESLQKADWLHNGFFAPKEATDFASLYPDQAIDIVMKKLHDIPKQPQKDYVLNGDINKMTNAGADFASTSNLKSNAGVNVIMPDGSNSQQIRVDNHIEVYDKTQQGVSLRDIGNNNNVSLVR